MSFHYYGEMQSYTFWLNIKVMTHFHMLTILRVSLMEQELPTLPEHLSSPQFLWGSCYSNFSFLCMLCRSLFVLLYFFLLAIVLSVLLRYTDSDYPFRIFKLFLQQLWGFMYSLLYCLGNNWHFLVELLFSTTFYCIAT